MGSTENAFSFRSRRGVRAIRVGFRTTAQVASLLLVAFALGCQSLVPSPSAICAREPKGPVASEETRHTADDALTTDGEEVSATGRFANAYVRICAYMKRDDSGWVLRGEGSSNALGWVSVSLDPISKPGDYPLRLEMPQDGSGAEATIFVRPKGTHIAVFDIDGTLTDSGSVPTVLRGYLAEPRPFGVELAQTLRDRGCLIIYLTARAYELTQATRKWREYWHFPQGVVHVSRSPLGLLGAKAGDYKRRFLEDVRGPKGAGYPRFVADFAFGNEFSDLSAYFSVYPGAQVYLIDYAAGSDGEKQSGNYRAVHHTWKEVNDELRARPLETDQPARACR